MFLIILTLRDAWMQISPAGQDGSGFKSLVTDTLPFHVMLEKTVALRVCNTVPPFQRQLTRLVSLACSASFRRTNSRSL